MRATDTKKTARQLPARQTSRKCAFGSTEIKKAMFEDINRGAESIDSSLASHFVHDNRVKERRDQDF